MKITDVEAIALGWPTPEREYWTALRPIGRVSELLVRVHTDAGFYGIGEAHGAGRSVGEIRETFPSADRDPIWEALFTIRPEIVAGEITLSDHPGWGIELDERTLERRGSWA